MAWNSHYVSNTFLKAVMSLHLTIHLKISKTSCFTLLWFLLQKRQHARDQRKVGMIGEGLHCQIIFLSFSFSIFKVLAPIPPVSWQHLCPDGQPPLLIISGHCYRHLCSSHWPPAGDAGLFCCSTCERPAAPALGSTGMLRSLPAPKPIPAGRVARTSPRTTTTSLLSE